MTLRWPPVLLVLLAALPSAAPAGPPEAGGRGALSRLEGAAARPIGPKGLRVEVSVPRSTAVDTEVDRREVDLSEGDQLLAFLDAVQRLRRLAAAQKAEEEAHPDRVRPFAYDVSSAGKRRALDEIAAIAERLRSTPPAAGERDALRRQLLELHHAVENSFRYPIKKDYEIVPEIVPMLLLKMRAHVAVEPGRGGTGSGPGDPPPSSFWSPRSVAGRDLYAGFGRKQVPAHDRPCTYVGPKTGWGAHPGFDVRCGGQRLEFKLGDEIYGGPFNTRVFDVLGYHTFAIDRMPALELRYDRRVLTEYNSRRYLFMRARVLAIPVARHVVTKIEDPFDRIDAAVLRDGRRLGGAELRRRLLRDPVVRKGHPRPETVAANYDTEFERQIATLVWQPGTVAYEPEAVHAVGAWDYDQLDHAARREVRAVFVLAAWLDEYNMRWENTRLAYAEEPEGTVLRHFFSDVGSGLADAHSMVRSTNSDVEGMRWEVTEARKDGGVRFSGFAVNVMNQAFAGLTWEDARWMCRRLSALSEPQILAALLATGMSAAEVRLALEKMLSKRQKMVADFGLGGELPAVMGRRIDRALDFDPERPDDLRAVTLSLAGGGTVVPPAGGWIVRGGHLVRR